MRKFLALFIGAPLLAIGLAACDGGPHRQELLFTDAQIDARATSGTDWNNMVTECGSGTTMPDSQSASANAWQDAKADTNMLACAVLAVRLDEGVNSTQAATYRDRVTAGLNAYIAEGPNQVKVLGTARSIAPMVIAADLIDDYRPALMNTFEDQLTNSHGTGVCDDTLIGVAHCSGENWGDNARASVTAIELYLNAPNSGKDYGAELITETGVFNEYTGQSTSGPPGTALNYQDGSAWRPSGSDPRGINAAGATVCSGTLNVDGVRSNDQARGGGPNCGATEAGQVNENYAYGGFQGNVMEWALMVRAGLVSNIVGNDAITRAATWLININAFPPEADDAWVIPAINSVRNLGGYSFTEQGCDAGSPGKNMSCSVSKYVY